MTNQRVTLKDVPIELWEFLDDRRVAQGAASITEVAREIYIKRAEKLRVRWPLTGETKDFSVYIPAEVYGPIKAGAADMGMSMMALLRSMLEDEYNEAIESENDGPPVQGHSTPV